MRKLLAAVTIFLGSFLLFGVQPMVGRTLLPAFGGTASVWIVCLCTFQALLPAGYLYAHLMAGRRWLSGVHVGLLLLAAVLSTGVAAWRYSFLDLALTGVPVLDVLVCVAAFAGLSYVVLSANVSLVSSSVGGTTSICAHVVPFWQCTTNSTKIRPLASVSPRAATRS